MLNVFDILAGFFLNGIVCIFSAYQAYMNFKLVLSLFAVFLLTGCGSSKHISDFGMLAKAIQSKEFEKFYHDRVKIGNEVIVYDAVGGFENAANVPIKGGGLVKFQKVNFKVEVGNSRIIVDPKIVLHRFVKEKGKYAFYFFYTEINTNINLTYNKRGELIDYGRGVF